MKFKTLLATAASAFVLLHCVVASAGLFDALDSSKENREIYAAATAQDKALVDQFYTLSEDGKTSEMTKAIDPKTDYRLRKLTPGSITIRRLYFKANNLGEIANEMHEFAKSPMDDEIGRRYVAFANARGNVVKQYKPAMSKTLNGMFEQHFEFKPAGNVANFYNVENALIEYAPSGQMVSLMTRSHQAVHNYNTRSWQYINIIFGADNAHFVENKITNSFFADTFQRAVTADAPKAQ